MVDVIDKNKLIILTGPSCVGKTPLIKSFQKLYPEQASKLKKIILYNSRSTRPYEKDGVDYYFRTREEIKDLKNNSNFIVLEVRGDLQALDTVELSDRLSESDVFYEGNTAYAKLLLKNEKLINIKKISIFISPFSKAEIIKLKADIGLKKLKKHVHETMKSKLLRRAKKYNQDLTDEVLKNINQRAADAYDELKDAWLYDFVIPNRDGEDSDNWSKITGDAVLVLNDFSFLLAGEKTKRCEKWGRDLLK